ncbi:C4-dicarboxylate transporter DctA [Caballeronia mineralivorans]|uniref:C4-dicarboxylate transporter DctA n=1 Tax=Caballeronia mineralivorans TaxID=2010198 RepID=UPI002AFEDF2E|nr:C4-dicarboxylate transporter DctA [Caballeronia mineralivorans]MEA3098316.1 aerobic C4-dicarboxylate transport protein [Caballeronia mineralivorans]
MASQNTRGNAKTPLLRRLYVQVLIGIALGILLGHFWPAAGADMKPLGDGFIKLIKMLLAPIIFGTIVVGIARMGAIHEVGRVGAKALLYFEVMSTLALVIGLVVVDIVKPGAGMNVDAAALDAHAVASYTTAAHTQAQGVTGFLMNIIPSTIIGSFADGNVLQIILFAVLFGLALGRIGEPAARLVDIIDNFLQGMFGIVRMVMALAPIGAFGAIAFTIGKYGLGSLASYGRLMLCVYLTSILFVFGALGVVARVCRVSLWSYLRYIREEILVTFGTASTESVLPQMLVKLEQAGCPRPIVGLVLPAGYTFNADGTSIYLTMAAIFVAQAMNIHLTFYEQLQILAVLMLTSKGSAGVAGAGFVTLAATLASMGKIPVSGLVLLLGVDRLLNEARAITNLIGNGLATIAVARWENAFDDVKWRAASGDQTRVAGSPATVKLADVSADNQS